MMYSSGYGELLDETPTFESLRQKVGEWTTKFSKISNSITGIESSLKKELKKVFKESAEELNFAISNLEAKYIKPKIPLNESEKLTKVMEELKESLLPPSNLSYNKLDRSEPDEIIIKRIRCQPNELIREIKDLSECIDKKNCETLKKVRLLGMCLISLRECVRKQKKITFKKALIENGIKYKPEYVSFLMRLARLLDKYPRLLRSSQPLYWFKSNMKYVQYICSNYSSEWREDARKFFTLTNNDEENEGLEYDEL